MGAISRGIQANKSGADLWSGIKTDTFTLEDFNKLNITETNVKLEYSDATLNKMYKENFQRPVAKMAGGNDKLALKSMTTNTSGGKVQYSGSPDGSLWVKSDGKMVKALAVTKGSAWGKSSITFGRATFASQERLAVTMAHELGHVTHNYLGLTQLASQKWDQSYIGDDVNSYGHAAIYEMQFNFSKINGFTFEANIPDLNIWRLFGNGAVLNDLSTKINYLSTIKIK